MTTSDFTITTGELAERLDAELIGPSDLIIHGLNTLERAKPGQASFIGDGRHAHGWATSQATAAFVTRGVEVPTNAKDDGRALLIVGNADLAMAEALGLFSIPEERPEPGVSSEAVIHPTAELGDEVTVSRNCYIGPRTKIGHRTILEPNVYIGRDCVIGDDCIFRFGVVIRERCSLGHRVSVHSNTVIGGDGFGYRPDGKGGLVKIPHLGTVEIHDDVEIGGCATIDRAKFNATVIEAHAKLDNQVQVGHNGHIGRGCVLAAQSGTAGSTVLGNFCQLAGQVGVADHVTLGDGVRVAGHSGVMRDVAAGETVGGVPAVNLGLYWRVQSAVYKLPSLLKILGRQGIRPTSIVPRDKMP
ncbi:MAG: UDP-3-O-(3-hydroxymyristoyl)glucosamine N-acyltransferase [Phycisphaerales bacterium]